MESQKKTYVIHENRIDELKKKISKLNTRSAKIGCAPVALEILGTELRTKKKSNPWTGKEETLVWNVHICQVHGEAPKLAGWEFIAKAEKVADTILVSAVPGEEVPHRYRDNQGQCEHCNHKRSRSRLYIVRNEQGEYKQIGSTCLSDFLGHISPEMIAQWFTLTSGDEVFSDDDEFFGGGSGDYSRLVTEVLAVSARLVDLFGYVTRKESEFGKADATSSLAQTYFFPPRAVDPVEKARLREFLSRATPTEKDHELAAKVVVWLEGLGESQSDYFHNLQTIVKTGSVSPKYLGITVSAVWAYLKEVEKQKKEVTERANKANEFVGEVSKRSEFTLTLKEVRYKGAALNGDDSFMVKFEDEAGNSLVWWTSAIQINDGETGGWFWKGKSIKLDDTMKVRATVKRHSEFKGRNITNIGRCFPVKG